MFLVLWLSLVEPPAQAALQIRFRLEPPLPPGEVLSASLEGVRVDAPSARQPTRQTVELPGSVSLDLPPRSTWTFRVIAKGYWSRETLVRVEGEGSFADILVRPVGAIAGSVQLPRGAVPARQVSARLRSSNARDPYEVTVVCPVREGKFSCELPAGTFDIRFHLVGFASEYRWRVPVLAGITKDQGALHFRRGASVVGLVEREDQVPLAADCIVEARPFLPDADGASEMAATDLRIIRAKLDASGFFQLVDVPPGLYVVAASQKGLAPASVFPITVLENVESELREPLVLRPYVELNVIVDPPRAPDGAPWKGQLFAHSKRSHSAKTVWQGEGSTGGTFALRSLAPGSYRFFLEDASGTRFAWEEFELDDDPEPLVIALDLVRVEGLIELGDEPLSATLWFGGKNGQVTARMESDAEGQFAGVLSRAGSWPVDVEAERPTVKAARLEVEVRPKSGGVAKVEIHLPATRLAGQVVREDGRAGSGAMVKWLTLGAVPEFLFADSDGTFEVAGVAPGTYSLDAELVDASSDSVTVTTSEADPASDVKLVLRQRVSLQGRVASTSGAVPGALIAAVAKASGGLIDAVVRTAVSDPVGDWRLTVPASTVEVLAIIQAPGYSLRSTRFVPPWDHPLPIEVTADGGNILLRWMSAASGTAPQNQPVLVQDGVILDFQTLADWARVNGEDSPGADHLLVPRLAPGNYSACLLTPGAVEMLLRGLAALNVERCSAATLSAYDTVELIAK